MEKIIKKLSKTTKNRYETDYNLLIIKVYLLLLYLIMLKENAKQYIQIKNYLYIIQKIMKKLQIKM